MYRLYIDETGNSDLAASANDPNHRYLSLTGIMMAKDVAAKSLFPEFERVKAEHLGAHPDEPVVFHRKDMMEGKGLFRILKDEGVRKAFDADLLKVLTDTNYTVITAVIDKRKHLEKYKAWRYDPYHYCMEVLLERYVRRLRGLQTTGDVWGEVRGKKHDRRLEDCFTRLYNRGCAYENAERMKECLTSKDIKLKPKSANVAGLQLADLLAHPSALTARHHIVGDVTPTGFGLTMSRLLMTAKYHRKPNGNILGVGVKWLP